MGNIIKFPPRGVFAKRKRPITCAPSYPTSREKENYDSVSPSPSDIRAYPIYENGYFASQDEEQINLCLCRALDMLLELGLTKVRISAEYEGAKIELFQKEAVPEEKK